MVADRTGFRTKYLPLSGQTENLSGLAAPELNSPARPCKSAKAPLMGRCYVAPPFTACPEWSEWGGAGIDFPNRPFLKMWVKPSPSWGGLELAPAQAALPYPQVWDGSGWWINEQSVQCHYFGSLSTSLSHT